MKAVLNGDLPKAGGQKPDPFTLADYTILLPSRRAVRAVSETFYKMSDSSALILPKIRAIGDSDAYLALMAAGGSGEEFMTLTSDGALPQTASDLERRLVLMQFVRRWVVEMQALAQSELEKVGKTNSPAQAVALAAELTEILDEAETEGATLTALADLVPDNYSIHWKRTLDFLKIITEWWPDYLRGQNLISKVELRDMLMRAEAKAYSLYPPKGPVIIAGEIGGVQAASELMQVVAVLEHGAVVLPGLDQELDEESWQTMAIPKLLDNGQTVMDGHPEHPQYGLKRFLDQMGASRADVQIVAGCLPDKVDKARLTLISETMRPAQTTHKWQNFPQGLDVASLKKTLEPISYITTETAQLEAEIVALILRRTAEQTDETAALITPDRTLARRVITILHKWDLVVDDSGGLPLTHSVQGAFLDLIIDVAEKDFDPAALLSLLKHPLTRFSMPIGDIRKAARVLELLGLRQLFGNTGLQAIKNNVKQSIGRRNIVVEGKADPVNKERHPVLRRLSDEDIALAETLLAQIETVFEPLTALFQSHQQYALGEIATAHRVVANALCLDETGSNESLWKSDAGEVLHNFFKALEGEKVPTPIATTEYGGLYRSLLANEAVRHPATHSRIFIWGPMEARILRADTVILGGLNEGTWPQAAEPDAWLNRPMRQKVGLSLPERKIGRSAHDVAQAFGSDRVYLLRAAKIDGIPSVASRWVQRLLALVEGAGLCDALMPPKQENWVAWASARDQVTPSPRSKRPEPKPPLKVRPKQLSVSQIEQWLLNPYGLFASSILNLSPLPDLGREPDGAVRGIVLHEALHQFTLKHQSDLPAHIAPELARLVDEQLKFYDMHPKVIAFWKPRFYRFAQWFEEYEPQLRKGIISQKTEVSGGLSLETKAGTFTLTARADRIDVHKDGSLTIYDYKTGTAPKSTQVLKFIYPQLPLEAAIAMAGQFEGIGQPRKVQNLCYIEAQGAKDKGSLIKIDGEKEGGVTALADRAVENLIDLVERYNDENVGYPCLRRSVFTAHRYNYDSFAHLARVKEWAVDDSGEGGD